MGEHHPMPHWLVVHWPRLRGRLDVLAGCDSPSIGPGSVLAEACAPGSFNARHARAYGSSMLSEAVPDRAHIYRQGGGNDGGVAVVAGEAEAI
jgi:hypothetical protein